MSRKTAGFIFLGVCIILAVLLLTKVITPIVSGCIFAVALVAYGLVSRDSAKKSSGLVEDNTKPTQRGDAAHPARRAGSEGDE